MGTKKGILIYEAGNGKDNVGDYIQSLAALQFLGGRADVYLNREHLNDYSGEKVALIMNGWFTHKPENWPPSKDIVPFFISFHVNVVAHERLLTDEVVKYLKQYEPIGCRDKKTVELLGNKGIDAYFSGCLTLTLGETYSSDDKDDKVYFVDPKYDPLKKNMSLLGLAFILSANFKTIKTIALKLVNATDFKSLLRTANFYKSYSEHFTDDILTSAEYIKHADRNAVFKDEEAKFDYSKVLLAKYAKAKLVVTSRLHCALPSLGMGTPMIYIDDVNQFEVSSCRLGGLLELANVIDYDKGKMTPRFKWENGKISSSTKITNRPDYLKLKAGLMAKVREFVKSI